MYQPVALVHQERAAPAVDLPRRHPITLLPAPAGRRTVEREASAKKSRDFRSQFTFGAMRSGRHVERGAQRSGPGRKLVETGGDPGFGAPRRAVYPGPVNIGVCASYWRFMQAPGGAAKAQR
ncbi:hypothetical protein MAGR_33760 [Mycolicibacterium agri]|uniref:Uncharacterized protein n=1 Tax=Mycolicibacterium agri TaxID=36811 RepID=A0A7I9W2K7_MYCAG|nr:hypothetical protein MAGR_33760 [Mycolicibacterium agri]